ncbi:MAG: GNAT family N-acetyltransferase [Gaiellaceae bacterium]
MPYRKAEVRPYRAEDEALLFDLARRTFGERGGWDERRTLTVLEGETVFIAEIDHAPAGYVALEELDEAVRIDQLLVSPDHEAQGVGHQLLEWAEGYAISARASILQVVVEPDNSRALDFYRRFGFAQVESGLFELVLPQE